MDSDTSSEDLQRDEAQKVELKPESLDSDSDDIPSVEEMDARVDSDFTESQKSEEE